MCMGDTWNSEYAGGVRRPPVANGRPEAIRPLQ